MGNVRLEMKTLVSLHGTDSSKTPLGAKHRPNTVGAFRARLDERGAIGQDEHGASAHRRHFSMT